MEFYWFESCGPTSPVNKKFIRKKDKWKHLSYKNVALNPIPIGGLYIATKFLSFFFSKRDEYPVLCELQLI